jgi:DNA-binding transcriptional regulator GbsR (MarR family)
MQLKEAKNQFISSWGAYGSNWGINRTMAQIHALLLVSPEPISTEDVMEELNISRGNASMNIRDLIEWGLVERVVISGERREFFEAEKDIWKVARMIVRERKKRELEPMLNVLEKISIIEGDKRVPEIKTFTETIQNIRKFGEKTDKALDILSKSDEKWFLNSLMKWFK